MSTQSIDELAHGIANIAHVEKPCLESMLEIEKLEIAKEPVDKEHLDALKKVEMWESELVSLNSWSFHWAILKLTCGLQTEKDNAAKGLTKAKKIVIETSDKVQTEKDKIHLVEVQNEKNSIDYRTLQKYREEITVLLDSALKVDFPGEKTLKTDMEDCKERSIEKFENIKKLETVKELLKSADMSILEGILELRQSAVKETLMGEGKVYFPQSAYDSLSEARALYPELPGFKSPTDYVNEADETGAYYSPMQKYLWDVRHRMAELIAWCQEEAIVLLEAETQIQIELGKKVDEYNLERRRILKEGLL